MKKYILILSAFAALVACSKETAIEETQTTEEPAVETSTEVHELFVSIADVKDEDTKAAIAEADGTFSWAAGNEIAVKTTTGDVYKFVATTANPNRFTYEGTMNGTPNEVVYPYNDAFVVESIPATLSSPTAALTDAVRLQGTISGNSVTMSHVNALLKVTFTNVPSFSSKLVFDVNHDGSADITITLPSTWDGVAYIPVDAATTSFGVSLLDSDNDSLISKETDSKTFTAGALKKMKAIDIPVAIYVKPFAGWEKMYAYVYYKNGDVYPQEVAWPGTEIPAGGVVAIPVSTANLNLETHVILNAGDANLAKAFTRIEAAAFTSNTSKLVTVSAVDQSNLKLFFRDDKGQNENWSGYYIYGWYSDSSLIFGSWPGWSKSASSFAWAEYGNYGQSNNWFASYEFTGKPEINLIINNNGGTQTADINLPAGKDNWLVVSDECITAQTESFPTISVTVE